MTSRMDDAIYHLSDDARLDAFNLNFQKLTAATRLDTHVLEICVRLLPRALPAVGSTLTSEPHEQLQDSILSFLPDEPQTSEHIYQIAEACAGSELFLFLLIRKICLELGADTSKEPREEYIRRTAALLTFLKCSFWLDIDRRIVAPRSLELSQFVGIEGLIEVALEAASALLSLDARQTPTRYTESQVDAPWLTADYHSPVMDQSLWSAFKVLSPAHFETKSSKLYKVWFQWISQAAKDNFDPEGVYEDLYWERVRTGLLTGFADQRKYCLGIVRASLLAARRDIATATMRMEVARRDVFIKAYDRYFILFETVVLDRYANQIEACLPELSALFGSQSVVTASMATTLLSSGLDPQVQEGIRKIVGNWYFGFMSGSQSPLAKNLESLTEHTSFLVRGFLLWATQGSLFTSTLKTGRKITECRHGAALVRLIACFVTSQHSSELYREELLASILGFVLDAGGKTFQMSTLFLLEGLIHGYNESAENGGECYN